MSNPLFIGRNFIKLDETPSTNTHALNLLAQSPEEGTVVQAVVQSRGRGQAGNRWESRPGENLTLSVILYPEFLMAAEMFYLSKVASLAVHACVSHFLPQSQVQIKWPNDILLGRQKVAGILIETQLSRQRLKACIIGIGLNVNQGHFPSELQRTACSLRQHAFHPLSLTEVCNQLMSCLESWYLRLKKGQQALIDRVYFEHLYGYQQEVDVRIGGAHYRRRMVGVDRSGRLALEWGEQLRYFDVKEITFILT